MSSLKPWREVAIPHEDVHRGTFVRAEFAADITRVHDGSATPEYQDPVLFFQRTFIKTSACLSLALMEDAILNLSGPGYGSLYFIDDYDDCMVEGVYSKLGL